MTNFQVYKKVLPFALYILLVDLISLLVVAGAASAGFFIANTSTDMALVGLAIGLVLGIVAAVLIDVFITNRIKAAQIAMMVKGVTTGELPEKTVSAGFNEIKGRFGKITAFYFITKAIKGIFNQVGHTINKIGTAVGGDVGNGVTSAINSAVQILLGYLCDCCLGWILFRKDENSAKAGCEGAVIFFKNGKTLFRNIGRIFGMGLLSFIIVGGAFFGISYAIFLQFPGMFESLAKEIAEVAIRNDSTAPEILTNPTFLTLVVAGILGIVMFFIIHGVFVRPFILTGVMRNFMAAGQKNMPTEADFATLDEKSPRFAKLHKSF